VSIAALVVDRYEMVWDWIRRLNHGCYVTVDAKKRSQSVSQPLRDKHGGGQEKKSKKAIDRSIDRSISAARSKSVGRQDLSRRTTEREGEVQ